MKVINCKELNRTLLSASILILLCVGPQSTTAQSLYNTFQKLKIPDIIPVTTSTSTIRVELNGNVVKPGDPIPAKNFKNLDIMKGVTWDVSGYEPKYTLMLLDLDKKPPTNGTLNIYNQYTNLNIPGNQIINGQVIVALEAPNVPCEVSTKHRLVILALHQDQNFDIADVAYISASAGHSARRENFKLEDFIKRHRLHLAAANVFVAIGETGSTCSGSITLHPQLFTMSWMLIVMVILQKMLKFQ